MQPRPYIVLSAGLIAVSTAATLSRLAQGDGMASLVIAAGRLLVAASVLTPLVVARYTGELRQLRASDWFLAAVCGVILGTHFTTWILSLEYTSLLASLCFYSTAPIFVNVLSRPLLGERIPRPIAVGTAIAFAGGLLIAAGAPRAQPVDGARLPWLGNALALASAITFALYLIIGRRLQREISVIPYIWLVYGFAALATAVPTLATGQQITGHTTTAYLCLLAIALVPQLIGHSSFNYGLRYLPAAHVGLVTRLEAVGGTILGAIVLAELPSLVETIGGAVLLAGVVYPQWLEVRRARRLRAEQARVEPTA